MKIRGFVQVAGKRPKRMMKKFVSLFADDPAIKRILFVGDAYWVVMDDESLDMALYIMQKRLDFERRHHTYFECLLLSEEQCCPYGEYWEFRRDNHANRI